MHRYRSHTCAALRKSDVGQTVRLSGWVHRVRDHGGVLFIDLRDHYGITQVVADPDSPSLQPLAEKVRGEWVIRIDGTVKARSDDTVNKAMATGEIELYAQEIEVLSAAKELPLPVFGEPGLSRRCAPQVSLPRPAPRNAAQEHRQAHPDHRRHARRHERSRLCRIFDADPDGLVAGRRARLPRAEPHPSRQVLRAAAGAAAVQAAADGGGLSTATSRSRPASATKTRAPTACRANSTSSTSK